MIEVEWQDENVKKVLAKGGEAADKVTQACVKRSHLWAEKIAREAQKMVPVQLGILLNSQEVLKQHYGFTISYGGKASEYAHYQHEGTNLQHHPPSNKWTYEGGIYTEGGPAGGGPGAWNDSSDWLGHPPTRFGKPIEYNSDKTEWRFPEVQYGRRSERASHGQNPGATDHWLYGASHSAVDKNLRGLNRDLTKVAINVIPELLRAA